MGVLLGWRGGDKMRREGGGEAKTLPARRGSFRLHARRPSSCKEGEVDGGNRADGIGADNCSVRSRELRGNKGMRGRRCSCPIRFPLQHTMRYRCKIESPPVSTQFK